MRERAPHHFRLLMDFFHHEMAVIAFINAIGTGRRMDLGAFDRLVGSIKNTGPFPCQNNPVPVIKIADLIGERGKCQGIRAQIHFTLAIADSKRRALSGTDQQIILTGKQYSESKSTAQARQYGFNGFHGIIDMPQGLREQLRHHFRVGV